MDLKEFAYSKHRIKFTKHALQRLHEFGIPCNRAVRMLIKSVEEKNLVLSKRRRRENEEQNIKYFRKGTILFTVRFTKHKITGKDIALVITVYDQRMDLK